MSPRHDVRHLVWIALLSACGASAAPVGSETASAPAAAPADEPADPEEVVQFDPFVVYDPAADVVYALGASARAWDGATGAERWVSTVDGDRIELVDDHVVVTTAGASPALAVLTLDGVLVGRCPVAPSDPSQQGSLTVSSVEPLLVQLAMAQPSGGAPELDPAGPVCTRSQVDLASCAMVWEPAACMPSSARWLGTTIRPRPGRVLSLVEGAAPAEGRCLDVPRTLRVEGEATWERALRARPGRCAPP